MLSSSLPPALSAALQQVRASAFTNNKPSNNRRASSLVFRLSDTGKTPSTHRITHGLSDAGLKTVESVLERLRNINNNNNNDTMLIPIRTIVTAIAHVCDSEDAIITQVQAFYKRITDNSKYWFFCPSSTSQTTFATFFSIYVCGDNANTATLQAAQEFCTLVIPVALFGHVALDTAVDLLCKYLLHGSVVYLATCKNIDFAKLAQMDREARVQQAVTQLSPSRTLPEYSSLMELAHLACLAQLKVPTNQAAIDELATMLPAGTWLAFDMDHTLIEFNNNQVQQIMFEAVMFALSSWVPGTGDEDEVLVKKCIDKLNPNAYDQRMSNKFVQIDVDGGNLFKATRDGIPMIAFHGTKQLTPDNSPTYSMTDAPEDLTLHRTIQTFFDRPIASVFACAVDILDDLLGDKRTPAVASRLYQKCFDRLNSAFIQAQSTFSEKGLHSHLEDDEKRKRLIRKNDHVARWLERLAKKYKLILITDAKLDHAKLCMGEAFGPKWQSYFLLTIVDAKKATFFKKVDRLPAQSLYTEGTRGLVFEGGSVADLQVFLGGSPSPFNPIYFGDHMQKDVRFPKEHGGWNTVAVVPEIYDFVFSYGALTKPTSASERCLPALSRNSSVRGSRRILMPSDPPIPSLFRNALVGDDLVTPTLLGSYIAKYAFLTIPSMSDAAHSNLFLG